MKTLAEDDLPNISPEFFDFNWVITEQDILATNVAQEGYFDSSDRVTKAILHLMGIDIHRNWEIDLLEPETKIRSEITGLIQTGGLVYRGYLRNDLNWNKDGLNITQKYLFGDSGWLVNVFGKKE